MFLLKPSLLFLGCLFALTTNADQETDKAIAEVQKDMRTPDFREQQTSKEAVELKQNIKNLAGSGANEQEIYNLTADILGNFQGQDMSTIIQMLSEAQKNPEAFYKNLSAAQKSKLQDVASRLPSAKQGRP